jgi:hypothetical protein
VRFPRKLEEHISFSINSRWHQRLLNSRGLGMKNRTEVLLSMTDQKMALISAAANWDGI